MRKEYIVDFEGTAIVYAESKDEAVDLVYSEDWDDLDIDFVSVDEEEEEEEDESEDGK